MRIIKIILEPYRNLPWNKILSVFYITFGLWCFNLAVLMAFLITLPILVEPEYIFEDWGKLISHWFTSPYQLYYFWFCFVWSIILNFSD